MKRKKRIDICYRRYDLSVEFPLVALTGDGWVSKNAPLTRMHFHNCLEIGLLLNGECRVYTETRTYDVKAPAVVFMPPNALHFTTALGAETCGWNWIYTDIGRMCPALSPEALAHISRMQQYSANICLIVPGGEHPEVYELTRLIAGEMARKSADYREEVRALMYALSVMLTRFSLEEVREQASPVKLMASLNPAIKYIEANFAESFKVDALADACHISAAHFRRLFRQVYNMSPLEYIENLRIEYACDLLYNCDYSVTQVGVLAGFSSASSFNRQFAKRYGTSPSQWRKKIKNEENPNVTRYLKGMS